MRQLVGTAAGLVEVVATERDNNWVLYFHGGHESAVTASAAELYADIGCSVLSVSRPGYGATDVGPMSPVRFAAIVDQVCRELSRQNFIAVVGTSFGGPQAVAYAAQFPCRARSLILHSAAPSSHPYPDSSLQKLGGKLLFNPRVEGSIWNAVSWLLQTAPQIGLRLMMSQLSKLPAKAWLAELGPFERQAIRDMFSEMRSGYGFSVDVKFAGSSGTKDRRCLQQQVLCPTLVTASRHDAGVSWQHAEDFHATIPDSHLVEVPAVSHLFWIGQTRPQLISEISQFLAPLIE